MISPTLLRGITWDHSRGYLPLVATAQRFNELRPDIRITWEKRSLQDFEDAPVEVLGQDYDFVVLDHPCIGRVVKAGVLLPLDRHIPAGFLADQAENSVGQSHASYTWEGNQWALAIDAAAPVAVWRQDLMDAAGLVPPQDWSGLLDLGRRGHIEVPGAPVHALMNFLMMCLAVGETPFATAERVVDPEVAEIALVHLRELMALCPESCWARNPIHSHDLMASAENTTARYCPFAYGYSNYSRPGYAARILTCGEPPRFENRPLQTVLGGAGLAIFAGRPARREAVAYAEFVADAETQRTLYTHNGGQPGHRQAWVDAENNHLTGNFFAATLAVLDRAFVRPRFDGYFRFQAEAAPLVQDCLRGIVPLRATATRLNTLYHQTTSAAPFPHETT